MTTFDVIATGSAGNAVAIGDGRILIDCGIPYSRLRPFVGGLRLVLLTHEHGDHFRPSTVRALHRERPALRWGCCDWMVLHLLAAGVDKRVIDVYEPNGMFYWYGSCHGFGVCPVKLVHNVPNCGYRIFFGREGNKLFYATDTGTLDGIDAKDYDLYLIEANHTRAELEARIREKESSGEYAYEREAARNHLSQEQALDWLAENMGLNSRYVFLHQHQPKEKSHGNTVDTNLQQPSSSSKDDAAGG